MKYEICNMKYSICYTLSAVRSASSTSVENIRQISLFLQNKPNFDFAVINLSSFITSKYEILSLWRGEKTNPIQSQFKAKTNPIPEMPKMNVSNYYTKVYRNKTAFRRKINKANSKPIQSQLLAPLARVFYTLGSNQQN